jgi:coenzyme F420-reducing hydrogenase beta subunit
MMLFSKPEDCCGCTACQSICPKNAISMQPDEKGFLYPHINQSLCVECGLCNEVCPMKKGPDKETNPHPDSYAVKHRSDEVRMKSSSGGMFTAISDWILEQGGTVYGAAFDAEFRVCHRRANTKEQRNTFRGSKYVQSNLGNIFSQVRNDLISDIPVLFSGTPCQVAGLSLFLQHTKTNMDQLYLCDLVCHGTPSPMIFNDYLDMMKIKYGSEIKSISFRYKPLGWRGYNISLTFQNGTSVQNKPDVMSYTDLFSSDIDLRPSCYQCPFANLFRPSDITIGDFWGIERSIPEYEDKMGVSLVLINTEKGKKLFHSIEEQVETRQVLLEQCMQWNLKQPSVPSAKTAPFWADYQKRGFRFVAKKYADAGIKGKVKYGVKTGLRILGLYDGVKKLIKRS